MAFPHLSNSLIFFFDTAFFFLTGFVPYSGYDGARLRYDWWNLTLLYGICGCQKVRQIIA